MILIYVLIFLAILIALLFCAIAYVYHEAFYSRKKGVNNPLDIPSGEQYQKNKSEMLELIDKLIELAIDSKTAD